MKILVDGKNLSLKTGTGIATYARNLCRTLKQNGHRVDVLYGESLGNSSNDLIREIAFFDAPRTARGQFQVIASWIDAALSPLKRAKPFPIPLDGRVITTQFASQLPEADAIWNATNVFLEADRAFALPFRPLRSFNTVRNATGSDVAHWTYPIPLKLAGARNVYTIHDLVPLRLPYTTLDHKRFYYKTIETICRDADLVLTVSETSKRDIHALFDVPDAKVVNTYQAVDLPAKYLTLDETLLREDLLGLYGLRPKQYILFYGAIEPKKNIGRLIEAYMSAPIDIPLVIVGKDGWLTTDDALVSRLSAAPANAIPSGADRPRLRRFTYASFPQLINLIRGARAVALPSVYEGFGLPIIEGMLCSTPVLTAGIGATREIAGDAALLVDPYDVRDIRDGLTAICRNEGLGADLVQRGHRRAAEFSTERYRARLEDAYRPLG